MNTKKRLFEKEESHQAMMQLKSILANAQSLLDQVEVFEDGLDAWVQSYLTKSDDYLEAIKKYITYGRETTLTPSQSAPAGSVAPPMPGSAAPANEPMMPSIMDFNPEMMAEPATDLSAEVEGPETPETEVPGPEMEGPEVEGPVEEPEGEEEEIEEEPEEEVQDGDEIEEEPIEGPEEGPATSSRAQLVGGGDATVNPEDIEDAEGDEEEIPPMDLMNMRKGEEDEMTDADLDQMNAETDVVDPEEDTEEFTGIEDADEE